MASPQATPAISTVYGPVQSWRYGQSLGVDLIRDVSTCSFNCIYCQLGDIVQKTKQRQLFVTTETVENDLKASPWQQADIITVSGSGEPTLALNLKDVLLMLKTKTDKPTLVLTNATLLHDPEVIEALCCADTVAVKLDAASPDKLQQMNRPVEGVTLDSIVSGIQLFKAQYQGKLAIQTMFMPTNRDEVNNLVTLIQQLAPDEVQLNTPKRPYPLSWHVDSRGNHRDTVPYETRSLRVIDKTDAHDIEQLLREKTGIPLISIYPPE